MKSSHHSNRSRKKLRQLAQELGIDVQGCVEAAYDLAKCVAESEQAARYAEIAALETGQLEERLLLENERLRQQAERVIVVNRQLVGLLMEEHHFIEAGWLQRCLAAAGKAQDWYLQRRLRLMLRRLQEYGGLRGVRKPRKDKGKRHAKHGGKRRGDHG